MAERMERISRIVSFSRCKAAQIAGRPRALPASPASLTTGSRLTRRSYMSRAACWTGWSGPTVTGGLVISALATTAAVLSCSRVHQVILPGQPDQEVGLRHHPDHLARVVDDGEGADPAGAEDVRHLLERGVLADGHDPARS